MVENGKVENEKKDVKTPEDVGQGTLLAGASEKPTEKKEPAKTEVLKKQINKKAPEPAEKNEEEPNREKHPMFADYVYRNNKGKKEILCHSRHCLTDGIKKFKPTITKLGDAGKEKKKKPHWIPEELAIKNGTRYVLIASVDELNPKPEKKEDNED